MKRIAIAELEGVALDWAVACTVESEKPDYTDDGEVHCESYSSDWSQCGPLIERYISALNQSGYGWWAHSGNHIGEATSPLVAACRAIVASHSHDGYVDVPGGLVEKE